MNTVEFKFENGDILKDNVTGFEGVVMVKAHYSSGKIEYGLQNQILQNGIPSDWQWIDESRLVKKESSKSIGFNIREE